jgi:hypothetical protein
MKLKMIFNFIFEEIAMARRTLTGAGLVIPLTRTAAAQSTTHTLEEKIGSLQWQMLEMQHELDILLEQQKTDTEEARYPFWPESLTDTILGQGFTNPQLIPVLRWEQVWLPSLLQEARFEDGDLTEFKTESRFVNRITAGLAYRPTPLVGFTLAYEYTWTNNGKSFAPVTNFLPAKAKEHDAHALLAGMTLGFVRRFFAECEV